MAEEILVHRPAYDLPQFDTKYGRDTASPVSSCRQQIKTYITSKCVCSTDCVKNKVFSFFPFINIMRSYQWKQGIIPEIVSGLCMSVMHIPMSLGFAILASLPAQYGLYSTIFPIIIYFFFGTSKHISIGTMAIISILISNIVEKQVENFTPSQHTTSMFGINGTEMTNNALEDTDELIQFKVGIVMAISFTVGAIQIAMGFLKLGVLASFMSMPFIAGFMAGAIMHIYTSQVPFCLGITIEKQMGIFKLPKLWYSIFKTLPEVNPAEVIISVITFALQVLIKEVINEKYKHKLKIPIPAELLAVIVSTVISHFSQLHDRYGIRVLKEIPTGIPAPKVPNFLNVETYLVDAFVIAIMIFVINISLAKFFSQKYQYPLDKNQEMLAYGIAHVAGSFFGSFAGCQAPPRTMVHDSTGGKTQLASLVSAVIVLLVCYFLAPLFYSLPNSVLGAIILVALIPLLKRFHDLPHMWRVNKSDFFVWIITFCSVTILDIDIGLGIGIGISVLTLLLQTHRASVESLGNAENTEIYMSHKQYTNLTHTSDMGLFIIRFRSALHFANTERFKEQLFMKTVNPATISKEINDGDEINVTIQKDHQGGNMDDFSKKQFEQNGSNMGYTETEVKTTRRPSINHLNEVPSPAIPTRNTSNGKTPSYYKTRNQVQPSTVIIMDCSTVTYIDLMGLNLLKQLRKMYSDVGMEFLLANCDRDLMKKLSTNDTDISEFVYPSIQDAVAKRHFIIKETTQF